ncbi:MAG TPA: Ig-like domain-containing protein, partial [Urbifossiella sp.]|nr:Ig-like domain-containing protein [Urbifossiella sp.]
AYTLGNLTGLTATNGVYVLTLTAAGSGVADAAGNPITANASTTFTVDVAAPTVTITPATTGPTNAANVAFTVAFSEPVAGVDTDPAGGFDFFAVTGTAPGAAIVSIVPGAAGVYTVTIDTGSGAGTVGLTFGANTVVTDAAGNAVSGLPAASGFTAVDHVRPTVVITDADADGVVAANAAVTFTVDVLDASGGGGVLTTADFENAGTAGVMVGTITTTAVAGGLRFGVLVTPTTGGTLLLRLKAGAAVADAAGNDPDLPVVAGRTLVVDAAAPTVTVSRPAGQAAVTNTQPLQFAVAFSEPVVGFGPGSVRLAGPGTAGAGIAVSGDGQSFVVTVSGLTADGAVTLTVPAAAVTDAAGNANAASAGGDNTVTLDTVPPAIGSPVLTPASDTGAADGVTADATPTFTGTAEAGATVELFEGATRLGTTTATVAGWTITSITLADGPHVLVARATDAAGNAADSAPVTVLIDTSRATVAVTLAPGQPDAVLGDDAGISVTFAVTTSEPVGSLNPAALAVVGTAGGRVTVITGSGTSFLVTVGAITGVGSVSVAVAEGAAADAAGNPTLAAPAGESVAVTFRVLPPLPTGQNSTDIYATVAGTAVTLFNADGSVRGMVAPFTRDESPFEVRVAVADITGDGVPDVVAGTAAGAPAAVRVLDGATGATVYSLGVFEGFRGGVFVAAGDLNGDGKAEFVVTPDQNGGPRVLVFDGATGRQLASFLGIQDENFRGGARVAVGDLNADGVADLLVSAGFGGGPRVAGFDGTSVAGGKEPKKLFADFFLFAPDLRDGAYVTVGDVDGDGYGDVIGGAGPGGAPHVLALSGYDLVTTGTLTPVASFFAGPLGLRGGVRVAAKDFDGDSRAELVTGSGDTAAVFVYGNAALTVADPQPDGGLELLPGLLPGVHVG